MNENKKFQYIVTLRWYVETNEEFVPGGKEADEKILDVLRHRSNGTPSCSTCPTRNPEGFAILKHHDFMGNRPIYMSVDKFKEAA